MKTFNVTLIINVVHSVIKTHSALTQLLGTFFSLSLHTTKKIVLLACFTGKKTQYLTVYLSHDQLDDSCLSLYDTHNSHLEEYHRFYCHIITNCWCCIIAALQFCWENNSTCLLPSPCDNSSCSTRLKCPGHSDCNDFIQIQNTESMWWVGVLMW